MNVQGMIQLEYFVVKKLDLGNDPPWMLQPFGDRLMGI